MAVLEAPTGGAERITRFTEMALPDPCQRLRRTGLGAGSPGFPELGVRVPEQTGKIKSRSSALGR